MVISRTLRALASWLLFPILVALAVFALALSGKHASEVNQLLSDECQRKYATAHNYGDSIIVDNWIPAPGLQGRPLRRCGEPGVTRRTL